MGKIFVLIGLLIVNISCSQSSKIDVDMEYNEEFIKKNGDYEKLLVSSTSLYIFTHQYDESFKNQHIKIFERKLNNSIGNSKLLGKLQGRISFAFSEDNSGTIILGIWDLNNFLVYRYSSGIITKLFEHENHIVWYDAVRNLFYDGYSLYRVQGNEKIKLTEKSTNSSYRLFGENVYKLSDKEGITQLEELDASLETKKIIFSTDKKLNLDFRISDSVTFYFLQGTAESKINLVQYRKNSFTTLMDNIDNISDDGFYVYKDLIGLITYKVDESMLGGFGGTRKSVIYSKDGGKVFNELNLEKGTLVPPYIFYKDSLFVGNLGNGILAKANL